MNTIPIRLATATSQGTPSLPCQIPLSHSKYALKSQNAPPNRAAVTSPACEGAWKRSGSPFASNCFAMNSFLVSLAVEEPTGTNCGSVALSILDEASAALMAGRSFVESCLDGPSRLMAVDTHDAAGDVHIFA